MKYLLPALLFVVAGCGSGGGGNALPTTNPAQVLAGPHILTQAQAYAYAQNAVPPSNGQAFTLPNCVPIYNSPPDFGGWNPSAPQVGSACGGISPVITGSPNTWHSYILNNNAAVWCSADVWNANAPPGLPMVTPNGQPVVSVIDAFFCHGTP